MLPHLIYEALPFAYILVGIAGAAFFDSTLIFIASFLMVLPGASVILMRHRFRRELRNMPMRGLQDVRPRIERSKRERRRRHVDSWPIADRNGEIICFDRRKGERRRACVI